MDNRVFNVNGSGKKMLADVLRLALFQSGGCYEKSVFGERKAAGWTFSEEKGLILLWHVDKSTGNAFIAPLGPEALAEMVYEWLSSEQATSVQLTDWDKDLDHDGHNSEGWRVYCEDWGHVGNNSYAIVAITPAYMWHGK